jgi:hypothetical protein
MRRCPAVRGLEEIPYAAGLLVGLPRFLRNPLTVGEARAVVAERLARRDERLLGLVRLATSSPSSAYARLFEHASCEYGDVERLVHDDGAEEALETLAAAGIYLTVEEFKARTPVIRGSLSFDAHPALVRNPQASRHVHARSSGSRGTGTHAHFGLPFIRDCAVNSLVHLEARGGLGWDMATWEAPGAGAMFRLLKYSAFGAPARAWFTPVDPAGAGLHRRYRLADRSVRGMSRVAGRPLPQAQVATVSDPLPFARWLSSTLAAGRTPHSVALTSAAVRLALAADEAGIDVAGAQIVLCGEPVTEARRAVIARSGIIAVPRYGSIETGPLGYACLAPAAADDVHLLRDLHAVIQAGGSVPALPPDALLISTLASTTPFTFLNLSLGDRAVMEDRSCACAFERPGLTVHLSEIRSFEKLTGTGVTFLGADVVHALEVELPRRVGGAPTDYQLVESASEDGLPRVTLVVHPRLGALDKERVLDTLVEALAPGDGGEHMMGLVFRQGASLTVERRPPHVGRSGKVQHLVLETSAASRSALPGPNSK